MKQLQALKTTQSGSANGKILIMWIIRLYPEFKRIFTIAAPKGAGMVNI